MTALGARDLNRATLARQGLLKPLLAEANRVLSLVAPGRQRSVELVD